MFYYVQDSFLRENVFLLASAVVCSSSEAQMTVVCSAIFFNAGVGDLNSHPLRHFLTPTAKI